MKPTLLNVTGRIDQAWDHFWFSPTDLFGLAVFRIVLCGAGFFFYLFRQLDYEMFFSEKGIFPYAISVSLAPEDYRSPIPWGALASSPSVGYALHIVFLCLLAGLALGLVSRKAAWIAFILNLVFLNRDAICAYGTDQVFSVFLLYLCFTKANSYLALRWPQKKDENKKEKKWTSVELTDDLGSSVGIRLIQIQLCIIYAYSGFEKAKGHTWWQGDAIWNTLANGQIVKMNFAFLQHVPLVLALMTFSCLMWECYFPVLIWNRKVRPFVLSMGLLMHLGIGLVMGLPFFAIIMVAPYFLFIDGAVLRNRFAWGLAKVGR